MQKVTHYICDICGTEYADKTDAELCEKSHIKPVAIKSVQFLPFTHNRRGCPTKICVEFPNGTEATYKLVSN